MTISSTPEGLVKLEQETELLATWWMQMPGGNTYWRCDVPSKHLPGQVLRLHYGDLEQHESGFCMPRQLGETAIWSYAGNVPRAILMAAQKAAGYRVLMEVDDNYTIGSPDTPGKHKHWQARMDNDGGNSSFEAHMHICKSASGVIVTTEELAKSYRRLNENVYVCPNSVDPDDWESPIWPDDGVLRIGYAASHSHWWDVAEIERACGWAAAQPDVEVYLYGLTREWTFPHVRVPWTEDLTEYRRSLQVLDVGLCPLRPNPWANGKSDIKAMEYAMAGALPIVSRTIPYEPWHDRVPVASTAKEFLKVVKWAVKNRDEVKAIAAEAKRYVLDERSIERSIEQWRIACTPQ